jgi:uncharacterized damage-inducible protein DinB
MTLKDTLLAEFDHEMGVTRRLLDRLPEHQFCWRPHEKSRALGALATHLGNIPNWGQTILNDATFDLERAPRDLEARASRADVLALFDDATTRTRSLMDRPDAEYLAKWSLRRGEQTMFVLPRIAAFRSFVINHTVHHRGQLSVYLRMTGVPLPPVYGPTADEG